MFQPLSTDIRIQVSFDHIGMPKLRKINNHETNLSIFTSNYILFTLPMACSAWLIMLKIEMNIYVDPGMDIIKIAPALGSIRHQPK